MKRIYFSGYAPVHFLSYEPVYSRFRAQSRFELMLSGGFRLKHSDGKVTFKSEGFYDAFDVDPAHILSVDQAREAHADVVVCAHLSDSLFPRSSGRSVQLYHGVSFKNYAVREKALSFDFLCLPGPYHARKYREKGLIRANGPRVLMTGFAKVDALVNGSLDRDLLLKRHNLDPDLPTILYAPTGDKNNSLETIGEQVIGNLSAVKDWNLVIKPHDHPKRSINWFERLASFEAANVRIIRDLNVVPWLHAADLLISDASSVITEFTLLDRPIVLLNVPKLFKRVLARGGALDLETYGHHLGPIVNDPDTIVEVVADQFGDSSAYQETRLSMALDVFHKPGSAAERVMAVTQYAADGDPSILSDIEELTS